MSEIRVISTSTIQAPSHAHCDSTNQKIHLTSWDLAPFQIEMNQKGLLFHNPINAAQDTQIQIQHLKHSLSSTLAFFPPLAGRLIITEHEDNTASSYIVCNNAGALFVHTKVAEVRVGDILQPKYVPPIVHSFFPLNRVRNYEGTSQPLLAVQVTELLDGIFIGVSMNHVIADGKSFWHFINSWAEISRGSTRVSKSPSLERCFIDGIEPPIRFPFTKEENQHSEISNPKTPLLPAERIFHFTKEKIAQLKLKANAEVSGGENNTVSSLQALLTHVWRSVIGCHRFDPQEEICYGLVVEVRQRIVPPLPESYFGNALQGALVTMKVGELLECGLGKAALEMKKVIASHSKEKMRNYYVSWVRTPFLFAGGDLSSSKFLATSSSPRFDFYGNDFGWGKPVAVRSGAANKSIGTVTVFGGAEEGSVDIEVCLPFEILEAMGNDPEFVDVISN